MAELALNEVGALAMEPSVPYAGIQPGLFFRVGVCTEENKGSRGGSEHRMAAAGGRLRFLLVPFVTFCKNPSFA